MTTKEQIAERIAYSYEELVKELNAPWMGGFDSYEDAYRFRQRLDRYRLTYPQNPFLSHAQVKDICMEHSLKLGPQFAFIADIPKKNQSEIDRYVSPDEGKYKSMPIPHPREVLEYLVHTLRGEVTLRHTANHRVGMTNVLEVTGFVDGWDMNFIMPIHSQMAIYSYPDRQAYGVSNLLICELNGEFYTYRIPEHLIDASIQIVQDNFGLESMGEYLVRQTTHLFTSIHIDEMLDYVSDNRWRKCMSVIAPGEMFNTKAMKEVDGYKYQLDDLTISKRSIFSDDPIVLDPVPGGYLVVTQWGEESGIVNTNQN